MKNIQGFGVAILLGLTALQTFAIEGLQLSVQYRQSLTDTNGWQTLTTSLAAEIGTNRTVFIYSNIVQHPNNGSSGNSLGHGGGIAKY
ncbi:MAG: hypothetical protein WCS94_15955 [Verrucomicrobiota bacterium]